MERSILIILIAQVSSFANSQGPPGPTNQDAAPDVLGQILDIVQGMKTQLDNLEVKVEDLKVEIGQVKSQAVSSSRVLSDQLKGVKLEVVSATTNMETVFDTLHSAVLLSMENITHAIKGEMIQKEVQNLSNKMEDLNASVSSNFDNISRLYEDNKTNQTTQCDMNEIEDFLEHSFENLRTQFSLVSQAIETERDEESLHCRNISSDIETLSGYLENSNVTIKVDKITDQLKQINDTVQELSGLRGDISLLKGAVEGLDEKVDVVTAAVENLQPTNMTTTAIQSINDKLDKLSYKSIWALHYEDSRFFHSSSAHILNGKLYLFSKYDEPFDIVAANEVCGEYDGYLVEFEDQEEFDFILHIINTVPDIPKGTYFTGYTDHVTEGQFLHVSSGATLDINVWSKGEPNNYKGNEHCASFPVEGTGLNDQACSYKGKFICEVPHPF